MTKNNDIKQIHDLIERYFDATATEAEERRLKQILATTKLLTPQIEEAKAVFSFYAASKAKAVPKRSKRFSMPRIAAAIAFVAVTATAATLLFHENKSENHCIAYVGRVEITDQDRVLSLMAGDLQSFGQAAENIEDDINNELSILAGELTL